MNQQQNELLFVVLKRSQAPKRSAFLVIVYFSCAVLSGGRLGNNAAVEHMAADENTYDTLLKARTAAFSSNQPVSNEQVSEKNLHSWIIGICFPWGFNAVWQ